jgi:ADP-ribose pyrophosphatase
MEAEPKKWTTVSQKVVFDHPRMVLTEDEVTLPNGKTVSYLRESPSLQHSVTTIALNGRNEILLQREYSYPPNEVMWQLPGGAINVDEDIMAAAKRELSEESGYTATKVTNLGYYYTNNRRSDRKQYVVLCEDLSLHKETEDPEEFIRSEWVSIPKLHDMITNGNFNNINLLAALNLWFHSKTA